MERSNLIYILVGRRKCGKTTLALKLVNAQAKRAIVIDTQRHPTYIDLGYTVVESMDELMAHRKTKENIYVVHSDATQVIDTINRHFVNCIVTLEDAGKYYPETVRNATPEKTMIVDCRKRNMDVIFMFHFLKEIPDYLIKNYDYLVLFKTGDSLTVKLHRFPNWDTVQKKMLKVRKSNNPHANEVIRLDD